MVMSTALKISHDQASKAPLLARSDSIQSTPSKRSDFLSGLEQQMQELWSKYVRCLDQDGLTDAAKELKNQYYSLYRCYRQNKDWKNAMNNN